MNIIVKVIEDEKKMQEKKKIKNLMMQKKYEKIIEKDVNLVI